MLCVFFCIAGFLACSDKKTTARDIADVFANDVSVTYDGRPHSISILNTLSTDTVLYSTDNISFSSTSPSFVDVGVYKIYYKVTRKGYNSLSSFATITILPTVLDGIYAADVAVVYDGQPHSISISGVLSTDAVTYSVDGLSFSSAVPYFTDVGEYTVFYRVERPYGDYKASCTVTIFPNVYGRYFNSTYGVVVLSKENTVISDIAGTGYIGSERFSVTNNILHYKELYFTLLSDSDCVYKIIASDRTLYFCYQPSGKLVISFADNNAIISLDGNAILSVPNYNYCESGEVSDYVDLCFEQAFEQTSEITNVAVSLSVRDENPITLDNQYRTYDGKPHGFEFSVPVVYLSAEKQFTELGRHTVKVAVLSDIFLPRILDCTLVILPDIAGVYVSAMHAIQISDGKMYYDGALLGELYIYNDEWAYNGLPITVTDNGIIYDGTSYTATTDSVIVVCIDGASYATLKIPPKTDRIDITFDGTILSFKIEDSILLSVSLNFERISVSLKDVPLNSIFADGITYFVLGYSDIYDPVVLLDVKSK
ncbi:MAG: hypothetical protein J1F69_04640 [Clostridiales bacterium]|nr:hypothetical protein [Clostridiales bacterium]